MRLATLSALTACLFGAVIVSAQKAEDEKDYSFSYQTDSSFRKELKGADGKILGEYGFRTPDGCMHVVKYQADTKGGYRILGSSKRDCIRKSLRRLAKAKSQRPTSTTTTTRRPRTTTRRPFRRTTTTTTERTTRAPIPRLTTPRILEPVNNAIDGPSTTPVSPGTTRHPSVHSRTSSPNTAPPSPVPSNPTPVTTTRRTTTSTTTTPRPRLTTARTTTTTRRPRPTTPKTTTTTPKRPTFAKSLTPDEPEPSYTFGFTTSTHGHSESGLPDGSKKGEYYWDGPDGWRRIVTYVANERGFFPKMRRVRIPTTTVAPPTTTPEAEEEGEAIAKQLDTSVPQGGFGCPYYFYYNTKINYHWEYCHPNGTKLGEFGELGPDNYVHVNNYYADARGFHPRLSKTAMTPEQIEVMAEYQSGAFILPKPDEERLATEKRIQAWMKENRERLANPLAV